MKVKHCEFGECKYNKDGICNAIEIEISTYWIDSRTPIPTCQTYEYKKKEEINMKQIMMKKK